MKMYIKALPVGILITLAVLACINYGSIATVARVF